MKIHSRFRGQSPRSSRDIPQSGHDIPLSPHDNPVRNSSSSDNHRKMENDKSSLPADTRAGLEITNSADLIVQEPVIKGRDTPKSGPSLGLARQLSAGSRTRSSWSGVPLAW